MTKVQQSIIIRACNVLGQITYPSNPADIRSIASRFNKAATRVLPYLSHSLFCLRIGDLVEADMFMTDAEREVK